MESKLEKKVETLNEEVVNKPSTKLLELRKAQAKELAAKRDNNFSIDEELNSIKEMLVDQGEPVVEEKVDSITLDNLAPMIPKTIEKKVIQKSPEEKAKEDLEKEKAKLAKQKAQEKEKAKLAKLKAQEKEKAKLSKQKAQANLIQTKKTLPASKADTITKVVKPVKRDYPVVLIDKSLTEDVQVDQVPNQNEIIMQDEGKANEITMNDDKKIEGLEEDNASNASAEDGAKKFFENTKPGRLADEVLEKPVEKKTIGKGIIDNLQRLREQILAQKKLERELMEVEAINVQKKELDLKSKLTELESIVREEEDNDFVSERIEELEDKNRHLTNELEKKSLDIKKLLTLQYNELPVIDPESLSLSPQFLDSITAVRAEELYAELEAVQNELTELREIHELNRQTLRLSAQKTDESKDNSEKYIEIFNKLREDIKIYKDRTIELEKELKTNKDHFDDITAQEKERFDRAIIKRQNEIDLKYLTKESDLINAYDAKLEESRRSLQEKFEERTRNTKLRLEARYKDKIKDQKVLETEIDRLTKKITTNNATIEEFKNQLQIKENDLEIKNNEIIALQAKLEVVSKVEDKQNYEEKISELQKQLEVANVDVTTLQDQINELNELNNDVESATASLEKSNSEVSRLQGRVNELNTQIESLNNVNDELELSKLEVEELQAQLIEANNELAKAKEEIINLQSQVEELNNLKQNFDLRTSKLEETNKELELLTSQMNTFNEVKKELEVKSQELEQSKQEIITLNSSINELYQFNEEAEEKHRDQKLKLDELTNALKQKEDELAKLQNEFNNEKLTDLESNSTSYLAQIGELESNLDSKTSELELVQAKLNELQSRNMETDTLLFDHKSNLQNIREELDNSNSTQKQLQEKVNNLNAEKYALNESLAKVLQERNNLTERLYNVTNDYSRSEQELIKIANELASIKQNNLVDNVDKTRKTDEDVYNLQAEIQALKINHETQFANHFEQLNELTAQLETQKREIENKANAIQELKAIVNDLESSKNQLDNQVIDEKEEPIVEASKENILPAINGRIQTLIASYSKSKDLIAFKYSNEVNKLEIDKKFANSSYEIARISQLINELTDKFNQVNTENDQRLQEEIQAILQVETPVAEAKEDTLDDNTINPFEEVYEDQVEVQEEEIDLEESQTSSIEEVAETNINEAVTVLLDDQVNEVNETEEVIDRVEESTELSIEKAETIDLIDEVAETVELQEETEEQLCIEVETPIQLTDEIIEEKPTVKAFEINDMPEDKAHHVGIVDQDYLNRLSNIHRMKRNLEARRTEYLRDYSDEANTDNEAHENIKKKIAEIKAKLSYLEQNYRSNKSYHPDRAREYENEKTKLYLELENREEQLRKSAEEGNRVKNLKFKNLIKNVDDQLIILDDEERQLKEAYLIKQQKLLSKSNREREILEKLEAERNLNGTNERRVIESKEQIKARTLATSPFEDEFAQPDQTVEQVASAVEETPLEHLTEEVDEQIGDTPQTEVIVEKNHNKIIRLDKILEKEKTLKSLYEKYAKAENVLVDSNKNVKEYKATRDELLSYNEELRVIDQSIEKLNVSINNEPRQDSSSNINKQIEKLNIRKNLMQNQVTYLRRRLSNMEENGQVQEYRKVVDKLDSMGSILQKYQTAKQGLQ